MFFKHYLQGFTVGLGDGGAAAPLDAAGRALLLRQRLKLAKAALLRGSGGVAM